MPNWNAIAVLAAIIPMTCACAADSGTEITRPDTANAVSLDPDSPNSYRIFAPELAKTLARAPQIDFAAGPSPKETHEIEALPQDLEIQLDLSVSRAVGLSADTKLLVRVDLFNALNISNFANPDGTLAVSNGTAFTPLASFGVARYTLDKLFGGITGPCRSYAIGGPRSMQLSGRLTF